MSLRALAPVLLVLATSCATVEEGLGVRGGALVTATLHTADGAPIRFWRWTPRDAAAPRVFIVPELGFDRALVTPLALRLRARGFDVATLEGRHVVEPSRTDGWRGWQVDVARAIRQHGAPVRVLALGVGGEAAFAIARAGGASGIVAVNVPLRHDVANVALADALARDFFDPHAWLEDALGTVLVGAGRSTPPRALAKLRKLSRPLPARLSRDVAARFVTREPIEPPSVPVRLLASVKDNVVAPEDALVTIDSVASARRMGAIELFARDYGHLDWLASDDALGDVVPVLVDELGALP